MDGQNIEIDRTRTRPRVGQTLMVESTVLLDPLTSAPYKGCDVCRHFNPRGYPRCTAYPDGIPLPILGGDIAHDRPLPGDHGIQFEPLSAEEVRERDRAFTLDMAESVATVDRRQSGWTRLR